MYNGMIIVDYNSESPYFLTFVVAVHFRIRCAIYSKLLALVESVKWNVIIYHIASKCVSNMYIVAWLNKYLQSTLP